MTALLGSADVAEAFSSPSADLLGHGKFGETWKVIVTSKGGVAETVAVKILHPDEFDLRLVKRETEGLRRFSSPSIVKLLETKDLEIAGTKRTVLVCEYVDGGNVTANVVHAGHPTQDQILAFAYGLLGAVSQLHEAEMVHRDIKLDNIILRGGDWADPVLIDFGLSKSLTEESYTNYPSQVGTYSYMSPEQLNGDRAKKASDLWACGIILYKLVTGQHPYFQNVAGLLAEDLADLASGPPPALPDGTYPLIEELVERLLNQAPHLRGSARRATKDLRKVVEDD